MLRISMPRGDIRLVRFQIYDSSGDISDVDFTEIYFTVKKSSYDIDYILQKTLSGGQIIKLGDGDYQIKIEPEDTDGLKFRTYEFDIELVYEDQIKQTEYGILEITKEVTFSGNEA